MCNRLTRRLPAASDDAGVTLLLVLLIVTGIGLVSGAMLSLETTGVRTTINIRDQAGNAYNADGAAQVAINSLSTGYGFTPALFNNATGTTCFGPNQTSGTRNLPGFYPGTGGVNGTLPSSASVTCLADPATGANAAGAPITSANRPAQAILTLGQTGEDGVNVRALSSNPLAVHGSVKSNSNINVVAPGTLQSDAAVAAYGVCAGSIVSTPTKSCSTNANLTDPGYASEASVVPTYQPVPTDVLANCPSGVVTFNPGYYDDAKSLSTLMDASGPCNGSTWWFKPGTYYFDFHNNLQDRDEYLGMLTGNNGTADQWAIGSGHLVAGTPVDGSGNVMLEPTDPPTIPGSCQSPIKSASAAGVQFIFGGDSQLALSGTADAEICGSYNTNRPPIAIYGVKTGNATVTTLAGTGSALKMSTVTSPGNPHFSNLPKAIQQSDGSATWNKNSNNTQTATIMASGYAPPSAIPAGSIVKSATVQVRHGNDQKYDNGTNKDKLTLTLTPRDVTGSLSASAITLPSPSLPDDNKLVTDSLNIYGGGTSAFVNYVHDNGFTGADMTYAARLTHDGEEDLDFIQIDISYVTPAFRAENIATTIANCMAKPYTVSPPTTACAVLSTSAGYSGHFYVQGTTYTPLAAIDLTLSSATQQVLRVGVISRSLWLRETAAFSYSGSVIETPDDASGSNGTPIVFLTVYVCPAVTITTCSADPGRITALRVKAKMTGSTPPATMSILSWSNLR